jgi:diadenosine tetraphosphate (Ap4A) HIT family hydrolase
MKVGLSIPMNKADWVYLFKRVFTPWKPRFNEDEVPWGGMLVDMSDALCRVYADGYPVTDGHLLFIPAFDDAATIAYATKKAVEYGLEMRRDSDWDAFNVGLNCGAAAGQTVWWPHVHLIPRRTGDMKDPTGGVRHVIPERGNYRLPTYQHTS